MMETLALYLGYPFVRYALIVGVLIALCASLLGVTLVLKRFSFIGDGLSHVAFGAMLDLREHVAGNAVPHQLPLAEAGGQPGPAQPLAQFHLSTPRLFLRPFYHTRQIISTIPEKFICYFPQNAL